nr:hypothetical protein TDPV-099 [Oriental turtle dovepox virus]
MQYPIIIHLIYDENINITVDEKYMLFNFLNQLLIKY